MPEQPSSANDSAADDAHTVRGVLTALRSSLVQITTGEKTALSYSRNLEQRSYYQGRIAAHNSVIAQLERLIAENPY